MGYRAAFWRATSLMSVLAALLAATDGGSSASAAQL
jgi:hypothetical protein